MKEYTDKKYGKKAKQGRDTLVFPPSDKSWLRVFIFAASILSGNSNAQRKKERERQDGKREGATYDFATLFHVARHG